MNTLGLAAPNQIRCQRAAVARPCRGSLRLRGLVVDTKVCVRCGSRFGRPADRTDRQWAAQHYCTITCYRSRESAPQADRFWRYVLKGPGCWEWQAALGGSDYGTFGVTRRRQIPAHRFSWELHFGPIPDGLWVLHHCDNRKCVRPDHLFLGTALDDRDHRGHRLADRHRPRAGLGGLGHRPEAQRMTEPQLPDKPMAATEFTFRVGLALGQALSLCPKPDPIPRIEPGQRFIQVWSEPDWLGYRQLLTFELKKP